MGCKSKINKKDLSTAVQTKSYRFIRQTYRIARWHRYPRLPDYHFDKRYAVVDSVRRRNIVASKYVRRAKDGYNTANNVAWFLFHTSAAWSNFSCKGGFLFEDLLLLANTKEKPLLLSAGFVKGA